MQASSRFYLQLIKNPNCKIWYRNAPIGKNTIGSIAKRIFGNAVLNSSKKSDHSARKTGIQCLLHAGIPPTNVQQLSGHKNVQSLNSYSTLSSNQQQKMSHILSKLIVIIVKILVFQKRIIKRVIMTVKFGQVMTNFLFEH